MADAPKSDGYVRPDAPNRTLNFTLTSMIPLSRIVNRCGEFPYFGHSPAWERLAFASRRTS